MAHHVRVLKAAYRITGSMADAEDVAQTVFLRIAQGGSERAAMQNPESYLYRAGINAALDLLRRRQGENAVPLDEAEGAPHLRSNCGLPPNHESEADGLRSWLRQALAKLGPRAGEMFVLRYLEDFDNRAIARMLKTSPAVVAVILYRTRSRLRHDFRTFMRGKR